MDIIFLGADSKKYEHYKNLSFEEVRHKMCSSNDIGFLNRLRTRLKLDKIKVKKVKTNIQAFLQYYDSFSINEIKETFETIILKNDNYNVDYIYHMADIHIDIKLDRNDEYNHVFNKLYQKLQQENKNALIVIVGDILDKKLALQPECVISTINFFTELTKICPVICIAGNHDMIEHNPGRIDSLTAIFHQTSIQNLYYLKKSGIYLYNNIAFGVSSLHDGKFVFGSSLPQDKIKIALWHGTVDTSKNLVGFELRGNKLVEDFKDYDICCLGDVHNYQYLNENKTMAYCSSLICQNYSEANDPYHGYLVWNLSDFTSHYQIIQNDYAHYSFTIVDNNINQIDLTNIPSHGKFRIKYDKTTSLNVIDEFISRIKSHTISPQIDKKPTLTKINVQVSEKTTKSTIHDHLVNYCNKMKFDSEDIIKEINDIDNTILIKEQKQIYQWKLLNLSFDNMFAYGENNFIDFSKIPDHQIVGIYAKNGWGKSSFIDIILFMLFGKTSRCSPQQRSDQIPTFLIHVDSNTFKGKLQFSIGNDIYTILRNGTRVTNQKIKTDISFYKNDQDLTSEHRIKTEKVISELIGTYDDFIANSVSLQSHDQSGSFKDKSQTKKKEFLSKMLKLDVLSNIQKEVSERLKKLENEKLVLETKTNGVNIETLQNEKNTLLFCLNNIDNNIQNSIHKLETETQELNKIKLHPVSIAKNIKSQIEEYKNTILKNQSSKEIEEKNKLLETFTLLPLEENILKIHDEVEREKCLLLSKLHQISHTPRSNDLEQLKQKLNEFHIVDDTEENNSQIIELQKQIVDDTIEEFDINDLIIFEKELESMVSVPLQYQIYCQNISIKQQLQKELDLCLSFKHKLDQYEYNPQCKFCLKNSLVQEFKKYVDQIPQLQHQIDMLHIDETILKIKNKHDHLQKQISILKSSYAKKQINILLQKNKAIMKQLNEKIWIENDIKALENKLIHEKILNLKQKDKLYETYRIEKNKSLDLIKNINRLKEEQRKLEFMEKTVIQLEKDLVLSLENEQKELQRENIKNNILELEKIINTNKLEKNNFEQQLEEINKKLNQYEQNISLLEYTLERKKLYYNLNIVVSKNGLSLYMLEYYLPLITETVNTIIEPYIKRTISLKLNEDCIDLDAYTQDKSCVNVFSGAESFITDLAFKITLGYYSMVSKSSIIFIDEAVSCLDVDKIKSIDTFLEFLKTHYEYSFLISHIQEMKEHTPFTLEIYKENNRSKLVS